MNTSIKNFPVETQKIICRNIFDSGDFDDYKYSVLCAKTDAEINDDIAWYNRNFGNISPSNVHVVYSNDHSELDDVLTISFDTDGESRSIDVDIASDKVERDDGAKSNTQQFLTYGGTVVYFKDVPEWVNNIIRDIVEDLLVFTYTVDKGTFDDRYTFEMMLSFLIQFEHSYGIKNYKKYF